MGNQETFWVRIYLKTRVEAHRFVSGGIEPFQMVGAV